MHNKNKKFEFRKIRVRTKVYGTPDRPRLSVCRTSKHMYTQLVDDTKGMTLASASTLNADTKKGGNIDAAKKIGKQIAEKAKSINIQKIVFDRGGRVYHGRVKAVAEGAREGGLQF